MFKPKSAVPYWDLTTFCHLHCCPMDQIAMISHLDYCNRLPTLLLSLPSAASPHSCNRCLVGYCLGPIMSLLCSEVSSGSHLPQSKSQGPYNGIPNYVTCASFVSQTLKKNKQKTKPSSPLSVLLNSATPYIPATEPLHWVFPLLERFFLQE